MRSVWFPLSSPVCDCPRCLTRSPMGAMHSHLPFSRRVFQLPPMGLIGYSVPMPPRRGEVPPNGGERCPRFSYIFVHLNRRTLVKASTSGGGAPVRGRKGSPYRQPSPSQLSTLRSQLSPVSASSSIMLVSTRSISFSISQRIPSFVSSRISPTILSSVLLRVPIQSPGSS